MPSSTSTAILAASAAGAAYLGYRALRNQPRDAVDGAEGFKSLGARRFHYVIVGGGSAGCVLAARLSENPSVSVLLLEAGGDNRLNETQSGWQGIDLQGGVFDWQFKTTPQEGTDGRVHDQPRGLLLGGCSSTNTVLHVRAPSGDYQRWEALYGCDGWGWPDMERCYKKMERFHPASADSAELSYHGEDGAIGVTQLGEKTAQAYITQTIQAFNNSGLGFNKDYNGSEMRGFSYAQLTVENGTRCDAFTGYLRRRGLNGKRPLDRPNLAVVRNAFVTKVVLDGKKAVGVSVRFAQEAGGFAKLATGPDVFIPATTEVILSAGAIGSPWLLQLSGIGPKDVLEEAGIPVQLAQEQVGRNLKDHLFVPLVWEFDDKDGLTTAPTLRMLGHLLRYVFTRTGPFSTGFIEAMGFADSGLTDEETGLAWAKRPDIQITVSPAFVGGPTPRGKTVFLEPFVDTTENYGVTILPTLLVPRSAGFVEIISSDPAVRPRIDPRYLQDPEDMEILKRAVRICLAAADAEPLRSRIKRIVWHPALLEHNGDTRSDAFLEAYIRRFVKHVYHQSCTVRMSSDPESPLDLRCRFRGIEGLRVVDASSFPDLVAANTNSPVIAFAERAAELIKEDSEPN